MPLARRGTAPAATLLTVIHRRVARRAWSALGAVALLAACGGSTKPAGYGLGGVANGALVPVAQRQTAPALAGPALAGGRLDVASYRGKVVALNVYASWCAPCQAEADTVSAVADATQADGVQFVGIGYQDSALNLSAYGSRHHIHYPSLTDPDGVLVAALTFRAPPTTYLIDKQGRVAGRVLGGVTVDGLTADLRQLAAEPA